LTWLLELALADRLPGADGELLSLMAALNANCCMTQ
jgi:hypothetical protein